MKKFLLGLAVIGGFLATIFRQQGRVDDAASDVPASATNAAASPTPSTPSPAVRTYRDGQYIGSVADAFYGDLQVKAIIANGKIADVQFLQYPNDHSTSRFVNGRAIPALKAEAITAQDADVDVVSGATESSIAFRQSLGDALAQAR